MMRMKTKPAGLSRKSNESNSGGVGDSPAVTNEWELRPGGMLVQKRTDSDRVVIPPPTIRLRVKYGSVYHEINISSQASFGELKKMLAGPTGLHHEDQKLIYKDKERDSRTFLDVVGVKDKSKIVLLEDPLSHEKRLLEMRKNVKMEKAAKTISEISLEIDRLAGQVSAIESIISKGGKVAEKNVLNLIELLMNQLIKLDGIMGDGDVKLQRKLQVKRVQKYVEALDVLKMKNSGEQVPVENQQKHSNGTQRLAPIQEQTPRHSNGLGIFTEHQQQPKSSINHLPIHQQYQQQQQQQQQVSKNTTSSPSVVTTQWETFDAVPPLIQMESPTRTTSTTNGHTPKFNWEFFD
ncbi:hypothetical protein ACFE04_027206 [Oxalis oulophora]